MFAINGRPLPRLDNYNAALKHWETIKPFRGDKSRPLGSNRRISMVIEKNERNGDIYCKYHGAAVVTYHPDESITINNRYRSLSTKIFCDNITPDGISLNSNKECLWLRRGSERKTSPDGYEWTSAVDHGYKVMRQITVKKDELGLWQPMVKPTPWRREKLNIKRASAALKKYPQLTVFREWLAMYIAMGGDQRGSTYYLGDKWLAMLADRDKWTELTNKYGNPVRDLRETIYGQEKCYDEHSCDYVTKWQDLKTWS